jgi:hypothetical protein
MQRGLTKRACALGVSGLVLAFGWNMPGITQTKPVAPAPSIEKDVAPVVTKFCTPCHQGKTPSGGLALEGAVTATLIGNKADAWERVARNVKSKHMPPQGMPQPSPMQRERFIQAIENSLAAGCNLNDPGRIVLRRLNREEYNNTVRDLLGIDFQPAADFPSDDVGYGFDNIGDVLSISPLLMEKYLDAASQIAEKAIRVPKATHTRLPADEMKILSGGASADGGVLMMSVGDLVGEFEAKVPGQYKISVNAGAQQAGPEPAKMGIWVNEMPIATVDVAALMGDPKSVTYLTPRIEKGKATVRVRFLNDFYDKNVGDRNLFIKFVDVEPPLGGSAVVPDSHSKIIPNPPIPGKELETARAYLTKFASRAFRRPVKPEEMDRVMAVVKLAHANKEPFEAQMQLGVTAVMVSPSFLFRVELDTATSGKTSRDLNAYEIASRLSYFLWSSMPDEALTNLAATGELMKPTVISAQAKRMMLDPKASAFAENFGGQWLELRLLRTFAPDTKLFPDYNDALRQDMEKETMSFFQAIMREDRSVLEFIDAPYTYLNERLAQHYGIEGVKGENFRKVVLPDKRRGGLLTQGSILTLTSNPTRTSPVKRGRWVLEQILGTPPPPPPPGVNQLGDAQGKVEGKTLRERMESHRKDPNCATCHQRMDPIGFSLENFDAVGKWRSKEDDEPIDASGVLPGGVKFNGSAELRNILLAQKNEFVKSLAEKMMIYASGRGLTANDKCFVEDVAKRVQTSNYRFTSLVVGVALSDPFLKRKISTPSK